MVRGRSGGGLCGLTALLRVAGRCRGLELTLTSRIASKFIARLESRPQLSPSSFATAGKAHVIQTSRSAWLQQSSTGIAVQPEMEQTPERIGIVSML